MNYPHENPQHFTQLHPHTPRNQQPLPIISRPISNSPQPILNQNKIQFTHSLNHSSSANTLARSQHAFHPVKPQSVRRVEDVKRSSVSPISKNRIQSKIQYLSIEGTYHPPPPVYSPRESTPRVVINSPPSQQKTPHPILKIRPSSSLSGNQTPRSNSQYFTKPHQQQPPQQIYEHHFHHVHQQSPRQNIIQVKQAYIREQQQMNTQLPHQYLDQPIQRAESQTISNHHSIANYHSIKKEQEQEEKEVEQQKKANQKSFVKFVNKKGEASNMKVYKSMEDYLKSKERNEEEEEVVHQAPNQKEQADYVISFNEHGNIKATEQEKEHMSSLNSKSYNRSYLSNTSQHQSSLHQQKESELRNQTQKHSSNPSWETPVEQHKLSEEEQKYSMLQEKKKSLVNYDQRSKSRSRSSSAHSNRRMREEEGEKHQYTNKAAYTSLHRREGTDLYNKQLSSKSYARINESKQLYSHQELGKNYEGEESGSSLSIANEEETDMFSIRLMIEEIYDRELERGLRRINEVHNRAMNKINVK